MRRRRSGLSRVFKQQALRARRARQARTAKALWWDEEDGESFAESANYTVTVYPVIYRAVIEDQGGRQVAQHRGDQDACYRWAERAVARLEKEH